MKVEHSCQVQWETENNGIIVFFFILKSEKQKKWNYRLLFHFRKWETENSGISSSFSFYKKCRLGFLICNFTKQNVLRYNSCNNSVLQNPYRHLDGKTKKIYFPQFYGFSLFIGLYLFLLFACAAVLHLCIVHVLYAIMQKQVCKLHTKILCFFPILLLILVLLVLSKFSGFILVLMVLS